MKNGIIFIVFLGLFGCSREVPFKDPAAKEECTTVVKASDALTVIENIKVIDWGPQSTTIGVNPNAQPGGELGIWIRLSSTKGLGEVQLMFNGQPAKVTTVVDDSLITAAIDSEQLNALGKKDISLMQTQTRKSFLVGVFSILSN